MSPTLRTCLALALAAAALGCKTPPRNVFLIPEQRFDQEVRIVALAPLVLPADLEEPERVRERFEALITSRLRELGYEVVPSSQFAGIWENSVEQLGGYFDPVTGKRDEEKFEALRSHCLAELEATCQADVLLHSSIRVVAAPFYGSTATWYGTDQSMQTMGSAILSGLAGGTPSGTIGALCLTVVIEDTHGADYFVGHGGIEVTARLTAGGMEAIPQHELFRDAERNEEAVTLALEGLEHGASSPAVKQGP